MQNRLTAFFPAVLLLAVLPFAGNAQITITSADMPFSGGSYRTSLADTLLFLDPTPTGANFTWDFSSLNPVAQNVENWVSPTSTDILYFLLFGISDVAQDVPVPELADIPLEDAFNFYASSSSQFAQVALAGKVGGVPLPIAFDNSDIWFRLPMNFGDTDTDASVFELAVPGVGGVLEERFRSNEVDGWGTLITPYGTFDVLRHRSEIDIRDSLTGGLGDFVIERRTIEYRWFGNGHGIPLLQIDVQEVAGISQVSRIAYMDSVRDLGTGTSIAAPVLENVQLYPNPAADFVQLQGQPLGDAAVALELVDALGRSVRTWQESPAGQPMNRRLDLEDLPAGRYNLVLRAGNARQSLPVVLH